MSYEAEISILTVCITTPVTQLQNNEEPIVWLQQFYGSLLGCGLRMMKSRLCGSIYFMDHYAGSTFNSNDEKPIVARKALDYNASCVL